jgi:predicted Rossmann-fold nucleotide-binding protein
MMDRKFWHPLSHMLDHMFHEKTVEREELAFARLADTAREAVDLVVAGLPAAIRDCLKPR